MATKRLEKEEEKQAEAARREEDLDTRSRNAPKGVEDRKIVRIEDPTEEDKRIEDPQAVDEDEEDLEEEEEEQAEDAETSAA